MRHDVDGWAKLHQERLCLAYNLAKVKMDSAVSQNKQRCDSKARSLPLITGERVWLMLLLNRLETLS